MKFSCHKEILAKEIGAAQKVISQKNSISIISNVLLEAKDDRLTIKATDSSLRFETQIPINLSSAGKIALFCDKFFNILRALPEGDIEFEIIDDKLQIVPASKKSINYQLKYQNPENFPESQEADESKFFRLPQKEFLNMASQTVFAVSDDEARIFMNGVFMEKKNGKLIMVATDGRRLSYIASEFENEIPDIEGIIIHPKFLNLIKELSYGEGEIALAIIDKTIYAHFDHLKISSGLIEGQFPNYERVIPDSQNYELSFERSELLEAIRRMAILADAKSKKVFFDFDDGKVTLTSDDSKIGEGKEELSCNYTGAPLKIAFNYSYLQDPLKIMDGKTATLKFTDANKAATLAPEAEGEFFHIIMPMQLD